MRESLVKWIEACHKELLREFSDSPDTALLIDSFLGQYDAVAGSLNQPHSKYLVWRENIKRLIKDLVYPGPKLLVPELKKEKKELIFWPWLTADFAQMFNLLPALEESADLTFCFYTNNHLYPEMLGDIPARSRCRVTHFVPFDLKAAKNDFGFQTKYRMIIKACEKLDTFTFSDELTIDFKTVVRESFELDWLFFHTREVYRRLRATLNFQAVFVGNDLTLPGRTVALLSRNEGIRSFSIMHGVLKNPLWKNIAVSDFFVFGKRDLTYLEGKVREGTHLHLSGSPLLDIKVKQRNLAVPKDKILVAFSGPGHSISVSNHIKSISALGTVLVEMSEDVEIRIHRKDDISYYAELIELPFVHVVDTDTEDIFSSLNKAKLLITGASMTVLDAMLYEVPVITLDMNDEIGYVQFVKAGATLHATTLNELRNYLLRLASGDSQLRASCIQKQNQFFEDSFDIKSIGSGPFIVNELENKIKNAAVKS